jgi:outer membrane receptor for ferrienterochelin and colicin
MILTRKSTDKLTGLITSEMAKNEERKKGAIANTEAL